MWEALDITEEEARGLAEVAQHDLALARDFARRALAAEDNDEACRLARSYQRAARSYRQTLAVKARLKRDLAAAAQAQARIQADTPRPRPGGAAVARRVGELRAALLRLGWDEAERPESEPETADPTADATADAPRDGRADAGAAVDACATFAYRRQDIEGIVAEACLTDDFCDEPLDDHVARLALDLGFAPDAIVRWRDLADPPKAALDAEPEDFDWRSSA